MNRIGKFFLFTWGAEVFHYSFGSLFSNFLGELCLEIVSQDWSLAFEEDIITQLWRSAHYPVLEKLRRHIKKMTAGEHREGSGTGMLCFRVHGNLSTLFLALSLSLSVCLSLFFCLCLSLSVSVCLNVSLCLSLSLPMSLSVSLSVSLPLSLSLSSL